MTESPLTEETTEDEPSGASEVVYANVFSALIHSQGALVFDELFPSRHERRDAVIEYLRTTQSAVTEEDIQAILLTFGGANPDAALHRVLDLYTDVRPHLYTSTHHVPVGPTVMYGLSVIDRREAPVASSLRMYPSRAARLEALREWLVLTDQVVPEETSDVAYLGVLDTVPGLTFGAGELKRKDDGSYHG